MAERRAPGDVTFSPDEWERIERLAAARKHKRRHADGPDGRSTTDGEIALGLLAGLPAEAVWTAAARLKKTAGYQWTIGDCRLRVHTTTQPDQLVIKSDAAAAAYYVLAEGRPALRQVRLLGGIDRARLAADGARKTTRGDGWQVTSWWVRVGQLDFPSAVWRQLSVPPPPEPDLSPPNDRSDGLSQLTMFGGAA